MSAAEVAEDAACDAALLGAIAQSSGEGASLTGGMFLHAPLGHVGERGGSVISSHVATTATATSSMIKGSSSVKPTVGPLPPLAALDLPLPPPSAQSLSLLFVTTESGEAGAAVDAVLALQHPSTRLVSTSESIAKVAFHHTSTPKGANGNLVPVLDWRVTASELRALLRFLCGLLSP